MSRRGFSLVELIVALLILAVGLLATVGMVLTSQRILARADLLHRSVLEGDAVAAALLRGDEDETGEVAFRWGTLQWSPATDGGGGVRIVGLGPGAGGGGTSGTGPGSGGGSGSGGNGGASGGIPDTLVLLRVWPPAPPARTTTSAITFDVQGGGFP